jgi:hypothetical protein
LFTKEATTARSTRRAAAALSLAVLLGLAACGDDDGDALASGDGDAAAADDGCVLEGASEADPEAIVDVALTEFALAPVPAEVTAGAVKFQAVNDGAEPHEVVIARYDGEIADLPTDDEGAVDEDQLPNGAVIGEIEGFAGGTCAGTFELEAGDYVLFCNIVEDEENGETEAHYTEGMVTAFTVT